MGSVESENTAGLGTARIEEAISAGEVSWEFLLEISRYCDPEGDPGMRATYEPLLGAACEVHTQKFGGDAELFPPLGGVYFHSDGEFFWNLTRAAIRFDCSEAWPLTYQVELMAEETLEWWPDADPESPEKEALLARGGGYLRGLIGSGRPAATRTPHLRRVFGIATWILAAILEENLGHSKNEPDAKPGPRFKSDLNQCRLDFISARSLFRAAIQRTAQSRYWQGALAGTFLLALFSLLLAGIFWWRGADAAYAVALPAGGLGALVSVLQRMSSGKLVLDVDTSRDLLEVFGMVRPLIGAVFGLAITAMLVGGLVPAVQIPEGQELAFFAGVGFLAGFNERWAQDMLESSADHVGTTRAARAEFSADRTAAADEVDKPR